MKLIEPKLSYIEKTTFDECLKEMKFQDIHIDENYEREINLDHLTFDGCLFENIDFNTIQLNHIDLIDVTFDKCDLSNQNFDHQYLNRVQFKNCKLIGTTFIETNLKDVLLKTVKDDTVIMLLHHFKMFILNILIYKKLLSMIRIVKK